MAINIRPSDWQCGKSIKECIDYAFDNEVACDVTFQLGDSEEISAHRLVLSLRSPVFFAMFNGSLATQESSVKIKDIDVDAFKQLMRYIYTDEACITSSHAVSTLYAAKKYLIPGLVRLCSSFLEGSIDIDNVCDLLEQGLQVDEDELVNRCIHLISLKTDKIITGAAWLNLSKPALKKILESPNISISELDLFNACIIWSSHECERSKKPPIPANQREMLGDILYKINMANLTLQQFSEKVIPSGLLSDLEELSVFKMLTNPSLKVDTPFDTGRQNCFLLLKPLNILDRTSDGECNFDSETFKFTLNVHSPLCLVEIHLYDLLGPHIINVNIRSKKVTNDSSQGAHLPLGYSVRNLAHMREYSEKNYSVLVYKLGDKVNLSQASYELSLTLLGETDTDLFDPLQYGDKNMTCLRSCRDSPLIGFGYRLEDEDCTNPKPAVGTLKDTTEGKVPTPPLPPRRKFSNQEVARF